MEAFLFGVFLGLVLPAIYLYHKGVLQKIWRERVRGEEDKTE